MQALSLNRYTTSVGQSAGRSVQDTSMQPGSTLSLLRDWLASADLSENGRLPPERDLAERFAVKRAQIRKALAVLEAEGRVWRHVGKGTFLSAGPSGGARGSLSGPPDIEAIADRTSPPEAMQARLIIEPELARLAALKATSAQIAELRDLCHRMRAAVTWSAYEELDWRFHNLIAEASGNTLLVEVQHLVNGVRRSVVWGRLAKRPVGPSPDYHSFDEHDAIVQAVAERDRRGAADAMRRHLASTASSLDEDAA